MNFFFSFWSTVRQKSLRNTGLDTLPNYVSDLVNKLLSVWTAVSRITASILWLQNEFTSVTLSFSVFDVEWTGMAFLALCNMEPWTGSAPLTRNKPLLFPLYNSERQGYLDANVCCVLSHLQWTSVYPQIMLSVHSNKVCSLLWNTLRLNSWQIEKTKMNTDLYSFIHH